MQIHNNKLVNLIIFNNNFFVIWYINITFAEKKYKQQFYGKNTLCYW